MRNCRVLGVSLLAVLAMLASTVGAALAATASSAEYPPGYPRLREIRAAHHPGYDRLVFEFAGRLPTQIGVHWADQVRDCAQGLPVRIAGNALLSVDMRYAQWTVPLPGRRTFDLPNIATVVPTCQFEGVLGYGVGVLKRTSILRTMRLTNPSRYVVDIGTRFPKAQVKTYFLDENRFAAGQEPYFRAVTRWAPVPAVARGALHRLYAGVTPSERAAGLRLLRSGSTGFTNLSISTADVARVWLRGPCSSGGSTVTVAGEITPTLKQFQSVRWVKIYDRDGHTEHPTGLSDSIPECLEP